MTRTEILKNASDIISKDRQSDYGDPEENFAVIGNLWSIYLDREIDAYDVANLMALLKIAPTAQPPDQHGLRYRPRRLRCLRGRDPEQDEVPVHTAASRGVPRALCPYLGDRQCLPSVVPAVPRSRR